MERDDGVFTRVGHYFRKYFLSFPNFEAIQNNKSHVNILITGNCDKNTVSIKFLITVVIKLTAQLLHTTDKGSFSSQFLKPDAKNRDFVLRNKIIWIERLGGCWS